MEPSCGETGSWNGEAQEILSDALAQLVGPYAHIRTFAKLKQFRRFATRYEKSKTCFQAPVALTCSWIILIIRQYGQLEVGQKLEKTEDMNTKAKSLAVAFLFVICATTTVGHAADDLQCKIKSAVDMTIRPVMEKYSIPGMAVGIIIAGKPYVFCYGVASAETRQPVTHDTLFEIGSLSKTFTATLTAYAQITGDLSLSDKTSKYLSALQDSKFGNVRLLNLARVRCRHA